MTSHFIEVYRSSYTGNTLYSRPTRIELLDWTLSETSKQKYLKTIQVIYLKWVKEKNGYYWMGKIEVPFYYRANPKYLIGKHPRKFVRYERAREIPYQKQLTLL